MACRNESVWWNILCACLMISIHKASSQVWGEAINIPINDSVSIEYVRYSTPMSWDEAVNKCGQSAPSLLQQHLLCFESRSQITRFFSQRDLFNGFHIWLSGRNCNSRIEEKCLSLQISERGSWHFAQNCGSRLGFICRKFVYKTPNITAPAPIETKQGILFCSETRSRNITWPASPGNSNISIKCPERMKGYAKWFCNGTTGQWGPGQPNLSSCRSIALTNVLRAAESDLENPRVKYSSRSDNVINLQETAESLRQMMKGLQTGGDLTTTVEILDKVEDIFLSQAPAMTPKQKKKMALDTSEHVINVCDQLLTKSEAWNDLPPENRHDTATTFLTAVDETGNILASSIETSKHEITTRNVILQVVKDDKGNKETRMETFMDNNQNSVSVEVGRETQHVVFAFYSDLRDILPLHQDTDGSRRMTINTAVISANISEGQLKDKVRIRLTHFNQSYTNSICAYWDTKRKEWNTNGCSVFESNQEYTVCECDHLTNFAVLMDMSGSSNELMLPDRVALAVITIIGCSISIICLGVCVVIFTFYRSLWGMRVMLHRNLCLSLLIAQTILLGGLERTENKIVCASIAGLLHYFFLCAFFWMFLEAFHILWLLIKVFNPKRNQVISFYVVGYGFPALIVAISAGVNHRGYGTSHYCWLNSQDGTIWGFVGPVIFIILFNIATLGYALLTTHRILKIRAKTQLKGLKMWVRGAAVLMPLLGVTWVIGFLYVDRNFVLFAYVFAVLNSLQGLGIFLFHCILNKKVNEHVRQSLTRSSVFRSSVMTRTSKTPSAKSSSSPKRRTSKFFVNPDHTESQNDDDMSLKTQNGLNIEQREPFLPPPYPERNCLNTNELYPLEVEKG